MRNNLPSCDPALIITGKAPHPQKHLGSKAGGSDRLARRFRLGSPFLAIPVVY
jgi:hypothetical protein